MRVSIFYKVSPETFLILRNIKRDMIKNICCCSRKAPVILVGF